MTGVFRVFKGRNNRTGAVAVELIMDASVYEKLKDRARVEGVSESTVLEHSLRQGMSDYWLHVAKHDSERYDWIKELFSLSKRDNELLEAIIEQNARLHEVLYAKDKQERIE